MEEKQEIEWLEAQKIAISRDLVAAAKQQLQFLAAVDRRRNLYGGPVLDQAIRRYKTCWLPLLAKHTESGVIEGSLVVPLDCEWIWHCHRLNPVQYKKDSENFYGRILDNQNVESSLQGKSKYQTAEIWTKLYPGEPFELDCTSNFSDRIADMYSGAADTITYDLVSAVKRQSSFCYQVSRPSMFDNRFLKDAVARYKGFLHLIKKNQERSMKRFCVPTYDIDLIWHSHQLQPLSYCKDMLELLGKVLEHDDTDSDRSEGEKLDVGFSETTKQWEDTYGLRYWRAGAMYKGSVPSPVVVTPHPSYFNTKNVISKKSQTFLHLPKSMVVEVLLEIVAVKNLPASQKGNLFVSFSKKQPDMFFNGSCTLSISSESKEKLVAGFECEPIGELVLALMSNSTSNMSISRPAKTIGTTSISFHDLVVHDSKLSVQKWLELKPHHSGTVDSKPVCLHVAASFTVPVPSPLILTMVKAHPPISINACLFPLPGTFKQIRGWTRFVDDNGNGIISLQMRNLKTTEGRNKSGSKREVVGVTRLSRKPRLLAEYAENKWSLKDSTFSFHIERQTSQDGHIFEVRGERQIKLFNGKRLEFEPKCFKERTETGSITAVEFSADHPYGKAVALFDMKSGLIKVNEEWFALPGIILAFILSGMLKKEGYNALIPNGVSLKGTPNSVVEVERQSSKHISSNSRALAMEAASTEAGSAVKSGGCGGGCGGGCSDGMVGAKSGGCGSGCGGGCGSGCGGGMVMVGAKSGGCGGGCGGDCSDGMVGAKSGGCGGGCGGCGAEVGANGADMAGRK